MQKKIIPISIIIITLNEEKYISKLLKSIRQQTVRPAEIIVADANSTDKTREIAKSFGCKIVPGGKSPAEGRNIGASHSQSKWLLFLDADIYFKNDFLEKSYRQLIKKKIGTATVWFRPKEHKVSLELMMFMYNTYQFVTQPVWPHAIGACIFSKKRVFDKLDGFDTKVTLAEDMDYVRRAIKVDKFMVLTTHVYYSMRRYIKEGKSNMVKKLILTELYRMLNGELRDKKIQDNILEYPMRRDWLKKDKENHKHKSPEITMRKKIKLIIDRKRTK